VRGTILYFQGISLILDNDRGRRITPSTWYPRIPNELWVWIWARMWSSPHLLTMGPVAHMWMFELKVVRGCLTWL